MSEVKEVMPVADPLAEGIVVPVEVNEKPADKEEAPKQ